jgi:hypothetical protein
MTIHETDNATFYPHYVNWCANHGTNPAPFNLLTDQGFHVKNGWDEPVCCCWVGMVMGIGIYHLLFLTTNPEITAMTRSRAISFLLGSVKEIMAEHDYTHGFVTTSIKSLVSLLDTLGWKTLDRDCYLLMN